MLHCRESNDSRRSDPSPSALAGRDATKRVCVTSVNEVFVSLDFFLSSIIPFLFGILFFYRNPVTLGRRSAKTGFKDRARSFFVSFSLSFSCTLSLFLFVFLSTSLSLRKRENIGSVQTLACTFDDDAIYVVQ